jgi:hypothetical protein
MEKQYGNLLFGWSNKALISLYNILFKHFPTILWFLPKFPPLKFSGKLRRFYIADDVLKEERVVENALEMRREMKKLYLSFGESLALCSKPFQNFQKYLPQIRKTQTTKNSRIEFHTYFAVTRESRYAKSFRGKFMKWSSPAKEHFFLEFLIKFL